MSSLLLGGSAVYLPQQSPRSFQPPQYSPHPQTAYVMQPQPLQPQPQLIVQQGGGSPMSTRGLIPSSQLECVS